MVHTKESLIAFEERVKQAFLAKQIRSPVHLSGGNEAQLLELFGDVRPTDWVFSTWRSHYHALLHGIPEEWLFNEILAGRSMYLMNREHRFMSSAIVGGMLPIACGVALGIKRGYGDLMPLMERHLPLTAKAIKEGQGDGTGLASIARTAFPPTERVWVFVGEMAASCGVFYEFIQYCAGQSLPVRVIIEDNGYSTDTPSDAVWGKMLKYDCSDIFITRYKYERVYPHVGVSEFVHF